MWLQGKNMFHRYNPLVGWHIMAAMSRWHHLLEVHLWSGVVWLNPNVSFHSKFKGFFHLFYILFFGGFLFIRNVGWFLFIRN